MDKPESLDNKAVRLSPLQSADVTNSKIISQTETPNIPVKVKSKFPLKLLIGLLLLIIIIITFGFYLYLKSNDQTAISSDNLQDQETITHTFDPTTEWETFSNSKFSFSFKYPSSLLQPCFTNQDDEETAVFYESSIKCNLKANSQSLLTVFVYNPSDFSIETIGEPTSTNKIYISGKEFTIDEHATSYTKEEKVIIARTTLSENIDLELQFLLNNVLDRNDVDQILSTFKFLEEDNIVTSIIYEGGLCQQGNVCSTTYEIAKNGQITKDDADFKTLDTNSIDRLTKLIENTNYQEIKENKFTGTCPIAYDGQEVTYTFYKTSGPEIIPSCTYDISKTHPLFVEIWQIVHPIQ